MELSAKLDAKPLVSVIIPCFNQGRFLAEAIASVQRQTYPKIEIIVVDDGSTDDTRRVATSHANVRYFYQQNAGLSSARNHGVSQAKGLFLVFLDADDILYPQAVECNLTHLLKHPAWALVSGGHDKVDEWLYPLPNTDGPSFLASAGFAAFLRGNYVGMHAAVMYRCRVFDEFSFDTSLKACEDYDLYLRVARKFPIGAHSDKVAAYRHHTSNMSRDICRMYRFVREVHARQRVLLRDEEERQAWRDGRDAWRQYYAHQLYDRVFGEIEEGGQWPTFSELRLLAVAMPRRFKDYVVKKSGRTARRFLKNFLPDALQRGLHRRGLYRQYTPRPGKVRPGDFHRTTPFSLDFGFDRGGAIDRYYIEAFLEENRHRVYGRVLEIGDNAYTVRFGGERISRSDILHIDERNPRATYIGDITNIPQIPSGEFDCIIFTQTLHLIYDFRGALRTCYRILKPGGCLLLTVPGISHIDRGEWRDYWLWSFTDVSMKRLMSDTFNGSSVDIRTYGNVYVAAAFLYGMGLPEFRRECLHQHDPSYQVIISVAAVKA